MFACWWQVGEISDWSSMGEAWSSERRFQQSQIAYPEGAAISVDRGALNGQDILETQKVHRSAMPGPGRRSRLS